VKKKEKGNGKKKEGRKENREDELTNFLEIVIQFTLTISLSDNKNRRW
jgi:hypothetical protein